MSSRQLRKLRKQQDLPGLSEDTQHVEEEEESEDEPISRPARPNPFSGFAALADDGEDDGDDHDEADDGGDDAEAPISEPTKPSEEPARAATKSKKSKKKKGKKKGANADTAATTSKTANHVPAAEDDIDRALAELNIEQSTRDASDKTQDQYSQELARLLSITTNHLKVINEMRALFGRETIQAAAAEDDSQQNANQRRARHLPQQVDLETYLKGYPGRTISEVMMRRNPFVQGKETWPRSAAGGLTMKQITSNPNANYVEYAFEHDKSYIALEASFYAYVQMYDPMRIVHFLHQHPYHVSSLIQVSKVAKQDQNSALSADLCERALFTFGRVTLSSFRKHIEQGRARMDFRRPENRQFWLAGYLYIKSLVMKGTYRTALEWAKLFLGIDPSDNYSMINYIHVLAIRAYEADWLLRFFDSELFNEACWTPSPMHDYVRQSSALARLQLKDVSGAKADIVRGIERVPWLYASLFSALNIDTPKSIWGIQPRDTQEELYTNLYIHMAKSLWDNPQATSVLVEAANMAQKPDVAKIPETEDVTLPIARFVYLDNTPALMTLLPREMLHADPNFDFDPLPPPRAENVFSNEIQELPWMPTSQSRQQPDPAVLAQMIPGFDPGLLDDELIAAEAEAEAEMEAEAEDGTGDVDDLQYGVFNRFINYFWPGRAGPEEGNAAGTGPEDGSEPSDEEDGTPRRNGP